MASVTTIRIRRGQFVAFFAFDVGYEVSLERIPTLCEATTIRPLSRKRQTPAYLQFTKPPVTLDLKTDERLFGTVATLQATVFDFGALSLAYRWRLPFDSDVTLDQLARIGIEIYGRDMEAAARKEIVALLDRIGPAISRQKISSLTEDYYLYILEELEPSLSAAQLLTQYRRDLAQALTFEASPLSDSQISETLNQSISYLEKDLAIIDWNAALVYDRDYEDTVRVLELLNVELLEARFIDQTLDKQVTTYAGLLFKPAKWPIPLRTPYRRVLQELTEWRIESTVLSERVTNALKLIGDLFLSRIHSAAVAKLHLPDWEKMIGEKLQILDELYKRVDDRVRTAQSQTLEVIIVALIVIELLLAVFRHN
jgi:hypothetical protein